MSVMCGSRYTMQRAAASPPINAPDDPQRQLVHRFAQASQRDEKAGGDRRPDARPVEHAVNEIGSHHGNRRLQRKARVLRIAPGVGDEQARLASDAGGDFGASRGGVRCRCQDGPAHRRSPRRPARRRVEAVAEMRRARGAVVGAGAPADANARRHSSLASTSSARISRGRSEGIAREQRQQFDEGFDKAMVDLGESRAIGDRPIWACFRSSTNSSASACRPGERRANGVRHNVAVTASSRRKAGLQRELGRILGRKRDRPVS